MTVKQLERYKKYYRDGIWSEAVLQALVAAGKLTDAEYREIVGADE